MSWEYSEPRLVEVIADPIIRAVMAADGVDPLLLMVFLRDMRQRRATAEFFTGRVPGSGPGSRCDRHKSGVGAAGVPDYGDEED